MKGGGTFIRQVRVVFCKRVYCWHGVSFLSVKCPGKIRANRLTSNVKCLSFSTMRWNVTPTMSNKTDVFQQKMSIECPFYDVIDVWTPKSLTVRLLGSETADLRESNGTKTLLSGIFSRFGPIRYLATRLSLRLLCCKEQRRFSQCFLVWGPALQGG